MPRKRKNERSDGRIQIQLDIGRDANGKRVRKFFYGKSRVEAEMKKAAYLQQTGGIPQTDLTVAEWVDEYLKIYPSDSNPLYSAQRIVPYKHIKQELGSRQLNSIRELDLQNFINGFSGKAKSTVSKQIQALKRVFSKARKNRLIPDDPSEDLSAPKAESGTHRALTQNEISLVLKCWDKVYSGLWMMVMLFAGLRRGEMIALDWSNVNLAERTLTVKQTAVIVKNKTVIEPRAKSVAGIRIIPITEPLYNALQAVPASDRQGLVCLSANGKPLTETAVRRGTERFISVVDRIQSGKPLTQYGKRTDLKPEPKPVFSFRLHDLRHTFCTLLFNSGVDVKTAQYLMGHSDISVTMRIYTHLSQEKQRVSEQAMLDYFGTLK